MEGSDDDRFIEQCLHKLDRFLRDGLVEDTVRHKGIVGIGQGDEINLSCFLYSLRGGKLIPWFFCGVGPVRTS